MTASQCRAVATIAHQMEDPATQSHDLLGVAREDLSIPHASELIDHSKSLSPAGSGRAGR